MQSVLLTHSNHLYSDPKQVQKMQQDMLKAQDEGITPQELVARIAADGRVPWP